MPRQSRIDAPGALHHIISRGIEKRKIFHDDDDYEKFLSRLGKLVIETDTTCYAWALMPNHFHLLLKTGGKPISKLMQRLLTGYVITFNQKHHRVGPLFQNRYKSILCQEDIYLKELVRYIHMNPLRAKIVTSKKQLDTYEYSGHSTLMNQRKTEWQETDFILSMFSGKKSIARKKYSEFVEDSLNQGKRDDLVGGGLIRSIGGWDKVKSRRKTKDFLKSDERILGESDFVDKILDSAQEKVKPENPLQNLDVTYHDLFRIVDDLMDVDLEKIIGKNRERKIVQARRLFCYWSVHELSISMTHLANILNISVPTVSKSVSRGQQIVNNNKYDLYGLIEDQKRKTSSL